MLQIQGLSKHFGPQTLFEDVTFQLNRGCRYGLVGANGAGKSTFLKILIGDEAPSDGSVVIPKTATVGVLRQDRFLDGEVSTIEHAMRGDEPAYAALAELEVLAASDDPDPARVSELEERVSALDGYTLRSRASSVLLGLGLRSEWLVNPLRTLSGGYRLRVLLAQLLVGKPDVLLLDEPTNHLDILSISWLEGFLKQYEGCAVIISHDHLFLNSVVTHVLDADYETITPYVGNYDQFVAQKELIRTQKETEQARAEKLIAEKRAVVERFKAKATKARQAQSRAKQIEKIEVVEVPRTTRRAQNLKFETIRPSGRDVLKVEHLFKAYGANRVLNGVSLEVKRGDRLAVIGANGLGKSTLLKILVGQLTADSGKVDWGHETKIGYFAQDHAEVLNDSRLTPLNFVWNACPDEGTSYVRGMLGRALFSGDEVEKAVTSLSGGEAARLIFCRLMVQKSNVLVLDEPTNHLDLESIEALVQALQKHDGTVIFVSHDRWFVSQLATRIFEIRADGFTDYAGSYQEFLAQGQHDHLDQQSVVAKAKQEKKAAQVVDSQASWADRKKLQNRLKALPKRRDELLEQIDGAETAMRAIEAQFCEPSFFTTHSAAQIEDLNRKKAGLAAQVDAWTTEWEAIEEEIASLT
jgi:ATPase subunit of ABC transporter with duplicated ATPase domains